MAADAPGYFKVPGTDTTMKIYGKAETWGYYTMDGGPDLHNFGTDEEPILVPVNEDWAKKNTTVQHHLRPRRHRHHHPEFLRRRERQGRVRDALQVRQGLLEHTPISACAHAYGEFGGLLIGQTNSLWVDWQYCAGYNDTWLEDFNGTQYRTRQIRYTFNPADNFKVGVSMEQEQVRRQYHQVRTGLPGRCQVLGRLGLRDGHRRLPEDRERYLRRPRC